MTTTKPAAILRVESPPGPLSSRGVTVTVACPTRETAVPHLLRSHHPAGRSVEVEALVTLAAMRHGAECRACDPGDARRRGLPWLRAHVGRLVGKAVVGQFASRRPAIASSVQP